MNQRTPGPPPARFEPGGGAPWRAHWFHIIFGHDDKPGRTFDVVLIGVIIASIVVSLLDSVAELHIGWSRIFYAVEWLFTAAFTLEFAMRVAVVRRPSRYIFSFFGMVDLLAVLPSYLSLFIAGSQYLVVVRALRILRIFRVLKLTQYMGEADLLWSTLLRARRKVLIFFSTVLTLVLIFGALMYLVEGPANGFTSIPRSMYWAIVTMTTVGFGDITPHTVLGQMITSVIMLVGYSIIAVPTGIFTAELAAGMRGKRGAPCPRCNLDGHAGDARYCRGCGERLAPPAG